MKLKVEYIPINEIKPYEKNAIIQRYEEFTGKKAVKINELRRILFNRFKK